ncbi:unnamed protein product [Vicia faba]|uniref:Uncharacterized protein n=1 Tax=Vicia faba TaxID=3906 RepID=A0AAV0ZZ34_VICFA|nr:unnamed protein product [Vicia faba]
MNQLIRHRQNLNIDSTILPHKPNTPVVMLAIVIHNVPISTHSGSTLLSITLFYSSFQNNDYSRLKLKETGANLFLLSHFIQPPYIPRDNHGTPKGCTLESFQTAKELKPLLLKIFFSFSTGSLPLSLIPLTTSVQKPSSSFSILSSPTTLASGLVSTVSTLLAWLLVATI